MFFHVVYKITPLSTIFKKRIIADSKEDAKQQLLRYEPKAEIIRVIG